MSEQQATWFITAFILGTGAAYAGLQVGVGLGEIAHALRALADALRKDGGK